MRKLAALCLAVSLAAPAFAADGPAPAKIEKPKKERKICKSYPSSESRLGVTVCKTASEWANDNGNSRYDNSGRTHGGAVNPDN
jgi:hypothetical protein